VPAVVFDFNFDDICTGDKRCSGCIELHGPMSSAVDTTLNLPLVRRVAIPDEQDWLPAARLGEPWALERFYSSYQPQVYSLCCRLLRRPVDAEDVAQTVFVRAFRELSRFRGDSAVRTWLYRIAVNESLGALRRRRETTEPLDDCHIAELSGDGWRGEAIVERLAVRAALNCLKPDQRAILVLRFWEGLSYDDISRVLGISLPAVKMRLLRARNEFRRHYEEDRP
jgi:RNA polymerase sigma-70 factor (ECF subfamily)